MPTLSKVILTLNITKKTIDKKSKKNVSQLIEKININKLKSNSSTTEQIIEYLTQFLKHLNDIKALLKKEPIDIIDNCIDKIQGYINERQEKIITIEDTLNDFVIITKKSNEIKPFDSNEFLFYTMDNSYIGCDSSQIPYK